MGGLGAVNARVSEVVAEVGASLSLIVGDQSVTDSVKVQVKAWCTVEFECVDAHGKRQDGSQGLGSFHFTFEQASEALIYVI